jgi:hypothetical protein
MHCVGQFPTQSAAKQVLFLTLPTDNGWTVTVGLPCSKAKAVFS